MVVTISIVEEISIVLIEAGEEGASLGNLTFLRILRILRLVRVLRVIRVLRFFRELRLMVSSIIGSVKSLLWTVLLITLMLYIVGVFITQTVADHLKSSPPGAPYEEELRELY